MDRHHRRRLLDRPLDHALDVSSALCRRRPRLDRGWAGPACGGYGGGYYGGGGGGFWSGLLGGLGGAWLGNEMFGNPRRQHVDPATPAAALHPDQGGGWGSGGDSSGWGNDAGQADMGGSSGGDFGGGGFGGGDSGGGGGDSGGGWRRLATLSLSKGKLFGGARASEVRKANVMRRFLCCFLAGICNPAIVSAPAMPPASHVDSRFRRA